MKFVFLLILATFLFSCNKKNEKLNDYKATNLIIKNGAKLIQGEEYEFIFKIDIPDENEFVAEIHYQQELINEFRNSIVKLKKIDNSHYSGKIKILPKTSWLNIILGTPKEILACPYNYRLPVYKNINDLEYSANTVLMENSDIKTYLKYFYDERSKYPENIAIYASRWGHELHLKILEKDSITSQIKYLEKYYYNNSELPLLQIIAYGLNQDSLNIKAAIDNIKNIKNSPALNNWTLYSLIIEISENRKVIGENLSKSLVEHLAMYNPYSFYTHTLINRGSLYRNIEPLLAINVINKVINKKPEIKYYNITKGLILSKYFLPDSMVEVNRIINLLLDLLNKCYNNNNLYLSGQDPYHALFLGKGLVQSIIYNTAMKTGNYQAAIESLKFSLEFYSPTSNNRGMTYDMISDLFLKTNQKDSAIKYLYYAYFLFPSKSSLLERLKILLQVSKYSDFSEELNRLDKKYNLHRARLTNKMPQIVYEDNTRVNLLNLRIPKLIFFTNTSCGTCKDLINEFITYQKKENSKVFPIIISSDDSEQLKKLNYYKILNTKIVVNWKEIIKYFEVGYSVPQYLALSSGNEIISKGDGYQKGSVNWKKLFY